MKNVLVTFPGKCGDILWSLPTVQHISRTCCVEAIVAVDFAVMPAYKHMLPLFHLQSYIKSAFTIDNWNCVGSPHGDQPWEAPPQDGYDEVYHLGYRYHPGICGNRLALVDFIPSQYGMVLSENITPFIRAPYNKGTMIPYVAIAFNGDYAPQKQAFMDKLRQSMPGCWFPDISGYSWPVAAAWIADAYAFVGDRSANWVLANGVGQKNILTYEPHPDRHATGRFGHTFGNPHWHETAIEFGYHPVVAAQKAYEILVNWKNEYLQAMREKNHASVEASTRGVSRPSDDSRTEDTTRR